MDHVERFRAVMQFRPFDRLPAIEWAGYWDQTLERWRAEGLSRDLADAAAVRAALGLDPYRQRWIVPRAEGFPKPPAHGAGVLRTDEDYERLKPLLYPRPAFDAAPLRAIAEAAGRGEAVFWMTLDGFFWFARTLLGIEPHLLAFHDQPDLLHRIHEDLLAFNLRALEEVCTVCRPEFVTFAEDMSYNHGPMISKACFDAFIGPYYRRIVPAIRDHGILTLVDSDGDVEPLIPWLEAVGIEGILPLERMAGVDVARIRRRHPRWRMIGGFDKTVMKHGEAAMRREFERLLPVMRGGGFIPSVDHQTPPDVSLDTYRVYVRLLKEYGLQAAEEPS